MKVNVSNGTSQIILSVLIVEDDRDKAFNLRRIIENYSSIFNGWQDFNCNIIMVEYKCIINGIDNLTPILFNGGSSFQDSHVYIEKSGGELDIIFCDHELGSILGSGDKLLQKTRDFEIANNKRIYKILHSVKSQFQNFQSEIYVDAIYDAKDEETIRTISMPVYEKKILKAILYGNPACYATLYKDDQFTSTKLHITKIYKKIPLQNILYIYGGYKKENYYFAYFDDKYEIAIDHYGEAMKVFKENPALFLEIGRSLYVSKVWFADNEVIANQLKFISSGNQLHLLNINEVEKKNKQKTFIYKILQKTKATEKEMRYLSSLIAPFFKF